MSRNILLVEPNYTTKFPPLGLMKISSYHKSLGDNVQFVKGDKDKDIPYIYWEKIYISSLFTYHWKITIETIKSYKNLVRGDISRIFVGGILATLMSEELWKETGIVPHRGLLKNAKDIGEDSDLVIDNMIPDYDLFNDSSHEYALVSDSYFGYSTRGCIRKCSFCGVHKLEPDFIEYIDIKKYVRSITEMYGVKHNLVLFDNNVLASKKLSNIISDICDLGFTKGNINNHNDHKRCYVDFNQGVDARIITEKLFKLLSKIEINPLRIAFDHIKYKDTYVRSVELAAKYDIRKLSNYILYNYNDTPEDFWERLKINIDLNKKHGLQIYSFPMKYIPLNAKDRTYIDKNWNWQFVRGVQRIINVMKGAVMAREDFFYRAFGETKEEFITILHMPEHLLMSRGREPQPEEKEWRSKFNSLTNNESKELIEILCENKSQNKLINVISKIKNRKLKNILNYYIKKESDLPLIDNIFDTGNL